MSILEWVGIVTIMVLFVWFLSWMWQVNRVIEKLEWQSDYIQRQVNNLFEQVREIKYPKVEK